MMEINSEVKKYILGCKHILVIKFRYIGDSIWMLPFVENLKRNLPHTKLSVMVNSGTEAFFHISKAVDQVIAFPRKEIKGSLSGIVRQLLFIKRIRKLKPAAVIELTEADRPAMISFLSGAKVRIGYNNENSWRNRLYTHIVRSRINSKHMIEYHLDVLRELGLTIYDSSINIRLEETVSQSLKKRFPSLFLRDDKKRVLVHPGARTYLRRWGTDKFAYLCDVLSNTCRIFLVAGPGEGEILRDVLNLMKTKPEICTNDLSLYEFAALCELSDMFIGNDSGPIHIASAKTFVVGVYGPTLPTIACPWTEKKLIFESRPLPCRPCRQDICRNSEYKACLNGISPMEVIEKIRGILSPSAAII